MHFYKFLHVRDKNITIKNSSEIYWFLAFKFASVYFQFERTDERNGVQNTSENNPNNFHRSIRSCLYQAVLVLVQFLCS